MHDAPPGMAEKRDKDEKELPEALFPLSELFPDVSLKHILHILRISNGNFDSAAEQLLSYDLIKDELDKLDQAEPTEPAEPEERLPPESFSDAVEALQVEQWAKRFELQDEIMELLEIDETERELVDWYLSQNSCRKLETVCDIMLNFDSRLPAAQQPRDKLDTASYNVLYLHGVDKSSPRVGTGGDTGSSNDHFLSMSDLLRKSSRGSSTPLENDRSWSELQKVIDDNPELNLPEKFYLVAMKWFHKDLDKILHTAIQLSEYFEKQPRNIMSADTSSIDFGVLAFGNNSLKDEITEYRQKQSSNGHGTISTKPMSIFENGSQPADLPKYSTYPPALEKLQSRAANLKQSRNTTGDKYLKSYYNHSIAETERKIRDLHGISQAQEVNQRVTQAKRTFKIDLHTLTVQNAMQALNSCLNYWWGQEMHLRNLENTKFEFTGLRHVDPFVIVTGRGLHSAGGIPKVKNATVGFLRQNGFKFEENTSIITVLGKRKNHR